MRPETLDPTGRRGDVAPRVSTLGRPNFTTQSLPPKNVFARTCVAPLAVPTIGSPPGRGLPLRHRAHRLGGGRGTEDIARQTPDLVQALHGRQLLEIGDRLGVPCEERKPSLRMPVHFLQKFSPATVRFHSNQTVYPSNTPVSSISGILRRTSTTKSSSMVVDKAGGAEFVGATPRS